MQLHGPKRVYTKDSLEFWFGKLEHEWDAFFSHPHLEAGRELYRTGGIREIELTASDAIVHCRVEKKDEYAVIEWSASGLAVRSSSADVLLANSIAVAGLHEIEELIADELELLPVDLPTNVQPAIPPGVTPVRSTPPPSNGAANGQVNGNGHGTTPVASEPNGRRPSASSASPAGGIAAPRSGTPSAAQSTRSKRDLLLRFRVHARGLICEPWWRDTSGTAVQALPAPAKANGKTPTASAAPAPSPMERMKVISLTALAKKSHFHFHAELGAYLLEQIGEIGHFLKVVLPTWERSFKIETDASVNRLKEGVKQVEVEARARRSQGNGIDLEWVFRTGERMIDGDQVRALRAAKGAPVVIPEVGLVALAPESLESVENWQNATASFADGAFPAYLLFSLFNDSRLKLIVSPELEQWRNAVLAPSKDGLALPDFLRPYQKRGVEWLAHLCDHGCHGLLADEMGLGKTVQVISLIAARPIDGASTLVVCPASVVPVWQEELRRFYPGIAVHVLKNGHDFRHESAHGVWIASYAQLRNHRSLLDRFEFGYVVLDEGQFIKNPDAKVTNTCFEIRARHRIVLTGTPLENRQLDLWSILHFLLPGLLGSRLGFENALLRDREGTMARLRAQLAPFILRRTKAQVATELPPKVEMDLLCPLTDVQRQEYARVCREGLERLGDDINQAMREKSFGFLSLLTRLRQICCDPDLLPWMQADTSASGKLALLVERLGEILSSGHKVVIFSQFVMFLKRVHEVLEQQFPDIARFELTGSTLDRQKPVQDFQSIDQPAFMLVSLKAAGTGITLHSADYVFLLDPWWNPSVEEQAVDRVHRIGQTRTVFVYRMITQGTIEERIQALKAEKKQIFRQLIDGVGAEVDFGAAFKSLHQLIELTTEPTESATTGE
ncbi:hypothetical protein ASA1KI_33180 [Opitutales bacterium ASA1]|uniref:DEAD/DEAH box helicase n=1 Tax=Congregicoccus parvus TaxID=3081749 RepID=UPI002B2C7F52|nr:hypothetical protein ASA1KI_33180 [Opitutales bacterium ASA1]